MDVTTNAPTPTGRLIQKIQRHVRLSTKKPPTSGPSTAATAQTDATYPWYFPRSRGATMSASTPKFEDDESAGAEPLHRPGADELTHRLGHAANTEPTMNTTIEIWNRSRRP